MRTSSHRDENAVSATSPPANRASCIAAQNFHHLKMVRILITPVFHHGGNYVLEYKSQLVKSG